MDKKARAGNPSASRPNPVPGCPMAAAFAVLGGQVEADPGLHGSRTTRQHFAGLRLRAAPISAKVLAEQLRELQADGLVERVETGPVPAPVVIA